MAKRHAIIIGAGLGGLTALDGALYFVQMNERLVYRVDAVVPTEM